jgi:hypothetical protein
MYFKQILDAALCFKTNLMPTGNDSSFFFGIGAQLKKKSLFLTDKDAFYREINVEFNCFR